MATFKKIIRSKGFYIWESIELKFKREQFARQQLSRLKLKTLKSLVSDDIGNELLCRLLLDCSNPDTNIRNKLICYILSIRTTNFPVKWSKYHIDQISNNDDHPWNQYIYRTLAEFSLHGQHDESFVRFLSRKVGDILLEILSSKNVNLARGAIDRQSSRAHKILKDIYMDLRSSDLKH